MPFELLDSDDAALFHGELAEILRHDELSVHIFHAGTDTNPTPPSTGWLWILLQVRNGVCITSTRRLKTHARNVFGAQSVVLDDLLAWPYARKPA